MPKTVMPIQKIESDETFMLKDREICAVGTFNAASGRTTVKKEFLERLAENYSKLKDKLKVPLILGHSSRKKNNTAAAGWLENVRVEGNKLLADITNVPKVIMELIKKKAYRGVSIEARGEWEDGTTGKKYQDVLTGLALLGAVHPAVPGLGDFNVTFESDNDTAYSVFYKLEDSAIKNNNDGDDDSSAKKKKEDEIKMTEQEIKELKEANQKLEDQNKVIMQEKADLETAKKEAEDKILQEKTKAKNADIGNFIVMSSKEDNMKILPKHAEKLKIVLESLEDETMIKFSEEGKEIEKTPYVILKEVISELPNLVEFKEKGSDTPPNKEVDVKDVKTDGVFSEESLKLHKLAEGIMERDKIKDYDTAMEIASQENPDL